MTHGQTQLVAPLRPPDKRNKYFTADQFTLSPDGQTVTCPQGQHTAVAYRQPRGDRTFCFPAHHCRDCLRWAACRSHKPTSQAQRKVSISAYRAEVDAARRYAATETFKADRRANGPRSNALSPPWCVTTARARPADAACSRLTFK